MIYLDASVGLAHLLGETRVPPDSLWSETLTSSRLLEYEVWTRINARGLRDSHRDVVETFLDGVDLVDLTPLVLARALDPLPVAVRTLDALHLATAVYLMEQSPPLELASYDERMLTAARALRIPLYRL